MNDSDLVGTIITIAVMLVVTIVMIVFMIYGPVTKYPVPLAPIPAPKGKNTYERTDKGKT